MVRRLVPAAVLLAAAALLAGCTSGGSDPAPTSSGASATATAVGADACPYAMDASVADYYPIQPSFSAGYSVAAQRSDSTTTDWAYVVSGDFPYSNWMAWYVYTLKGVPVLKVSGSELTPDAGSTNPFVSGNPVLAPTRSYHLYLMPSDTPSSVVSAMQAEGKNVELLPAPTGDAQNGFSLVFRSYWSFANDGLGDYDRWGYGGPTKTPVHAISAMATDPSSGELTSSPEPCASSSLLPEKIRYDPATGSPVVTFENAPRPTDRELADLPKWFLQTGSGGYTAAKEFPPSPVPSQVQFYRDVASAAPYADVSSAPPKGSPPDACGGYVMANLPNDVVSLVHIPSVPTFPDYRGATATTLNTSDADQVQFYSVVSYGATKQVDALGQPDNSQIGNSQITKAADGSATVVLWPQSATQAQVKQIVAVAEANSWNVLRNGVQTAVEPNLLVIREKGQNAQWANALAANDVTQGAPCPQSTNATLPLPQDPPSAAVTQTNGMGRTAPSGQNCSIADFLSGRCLAALQARLRSTGQVWSASGGWPAQQAP